MEYISLFPRVIYFYVELNNIIVMTFKEDFKPSRVYNKLVIDAINKDIANDRNIIIPNTFDIDVKNNNKKYLCGTGRMECFDTGKIIKRYYSNVGINAWREIVELRSIILHELFYFINYTICFNSNVVKISKDLFDAVCRNGIRSGCNKRDFANAIVTLEKLNIIRRTDKRSMFEVNPRVIFKGDINKFHEIITKGKLDDSKIKLDDNINYIDRIGLVKDDNCIIIKNKQVYKSELDYLYDDNENNVDKANNETEIIEAEEVDTSKLIRIGNDDKDENDSIEKEGYKYNEDKCNNKDNDDDDSDNDDSDNDD